MQTFAKESRVIVDAANSESSNKSTIHVLHVDDDPVILEVSKQILKDIGNFEIDTACSVCEGLKKLSAENFDVVISDYEMPQKDGLQFLKELREQNNEISFILFTGKGREEVVIRALNLGADAYINKQGNPETVYGELSHSIVKTFEHKNSKKMLEDAEDALLDAGQKFKTIFENVHDVITYVDTHGKILDVNDRVEDLLGYKREEIIGKNFVKLGLIRFGDAPKLLKLFVGSLLKGEEKKIIVLELKHKNGSKVSVEVGTRFVRNKKGKIISVVNIFRDVTENKKVEAALLESEERFRNVFTIGHDAFLISDLKDSTVIDVNERFEEMFGYSRQEAINKSAIELGLWANPSEREKIASHLKSRGKIENLEISCKRKNGESFPIRLSVSLLQANNQRLVLSTVKDLSDSKQTEEALKESEEKFRNLAEESPNAIFINKRGRVVYANKKSEEITGYAREELCSPTFNFLALCSPEYAEVMSSSYAKHLRGEDTSSYDYVLITKAGNRIDVMTTSKLINFEGEKAILGIVTDISELKKAQENFNEIMTELVNVNEKLGVVGSLSRHDVRNKLSVITGNIYLLKKRCPDNPEIMDRLGEIELACKSIVRIFDLAKMYEQIGVEKLISINVKQNVDEAAALFLGLPDVKIINECQGLTVLADSSLRQLFYNMIDNSIKHGKRVTTIRVHWEKVDQGELLLTYEDNGVGVPPQNKLELFKEGFSTAGSTGFGLFLTKKMMDVYGWEIQENGTPGEGAKFTITIPKLSKNGKENYQIAQ